MGFVTFTPIANPRQGKRTGRGTLHKNNPVTKQPGDQTERNRYNCSSEHCFFASVIVRLSTKLALVFHGLCPKKVKTRMHPFQIILHGEVS